MNEEKFQALYKNTKKEEIIKELYFKCKANYKLENIIKEIKEIFKYYGTKEDIVGYSNYTITGEDLIKLLEILDKENK